MQDFRRSAVGPLASIFLLAGVISDAHGFTPSPPLRGVVELFTSQGCSSCPPADALLRAMASDPDLLALSLPVNYWDYIGWKDTLAADAFTARQAAYAASRGDHQIYTPQAVIDGSSLAIGSDSQAIGAAYATGKRQGALSVPMHLTATGDRLTIEVGNAVPGGTETASVLLLTVSRSATVPITRGENAGRTVTYTNVVRSITKIGDWTGHDASFEIDRQDSQSASGFAVLLQAEPQGRPGLILAAAKQNL